MLLVEMTSSFAARKTVLWMQPCAYVTFKLVVKFKNKSCITTTKRRCF